MVEVTVGNVQETDTDEAGAKDETTNPLEAAVVAVVITLLPDDGANHVAEVFERKVRNSLAGQYRLGRNGGGGNRVDRTLSDELAALLGPSCQCHKELSVPKECHSIE